MITITRERKRQNENADRPKRR